MKKEKKEAVKIIVCHACKNPTIEAESITQPGGRFLCKKCYNLLSNDFYMIRGRK